MSDQPTAYYLTRRAMDNKVAFFRESDGRRITHWWNTQALAIEEFNGEYPDATYVDRTTELDKPD